jgi:UDP-N-acetylmuramoylalanine--D-glutamate ligase
MGLGRHGGGAAAARYLAEQGAIVTVTDLADAAGLAEPVADLNDAGIEAFHLGGHSEADFRSAELVVVNPAVKPDNRWVELARQSGARITSEIELFLDACPAPVIGVTGTSGKSTTAAITAAILAVSSIRRVWLGGNIGVSLLGDLGEISAEDRVVLELSSFQLFWLSETARWPATAVVTNLAPNHLDWHGTMPHYTEAKRRLVNHVRRGGACVFEAADPLMRAWTESANGRLIPPLADEQIPPLLVPGRHNRRNAGHAAAAAMAAGADSDAVRRGVGDFRGLPHRLATVAFVAGRTFINDSKSTTPTATLAALDAIQKPIWLLLGGADKGVDLRPLAVAAGQRAHGAAFFGAVGGQLEALLDKVAPHLPRARAKTLDEALAWCWARSRPGDAIVLSPGCSSLDQFRDFAERGQRFADLAAALAVSRAARGVV